jgi:hypothetical protein
MTTGTETGTTAAILDWLASPPSGGFSEEVSELSIHLGMLREPGISAAQYHRCIELFYGRALRIAVECRPRLTEIGLPMSRSLHNLSRQLVASLTTIAEGLLQATELVHNGSVRNQSNPIDTLAARGLRMLCEAYEIAGLTGGSPTPKLWGCAFDLFASSAADTPPGETEPRDSVQFAFKRLLAIACIQIERLSQSEINWISEYLDHIATLVQIDNTPPAATDASCFWIACKVDEAPCAFLRKAPPQEGPLLYISMAPLVKRTAEYLARLEADQHPQELNLPKLADGVQPTALLQRLRHQWTVPAKREQPRRKSQYSVQACAGIPAIWRTLRGSDSPDESAIQEWQVDNESPSGFAIIHVAGKIAGLNAGMAVSLRTSPDEPWTICVVRWIRSSAPEQIELGLQVASTGATPVTIGFRGGRERSNRMVNALVLPALPALRHHPAVLAPLGTYSSRRFALVSDIERIYIAQGRLLSLDMQTATIELFQFEIDPYPI